MSEKPEILEASAHLWSALQHGLDVKKGVCFFRSSTINKSLLKCEQTVSQYVARSAAVPVDKDMVPIPFGGFMRYILWLASGHQMSYLFLFAFKLTQKFLTSSALSVL